MTKAKTEKVKIHQEMSVPEIVSAFPQTEAVFTQYGIPPQGYKALEYETLFATARVHQIELDALLTALNKAVAG